MSQIIDIPDWMLPLSEQGTKIHHTILRNTAQDEWELGDIASRVLVTRLRERLAERSQQLEEVKAVAEKFRELVEKFKGLCEKAIHRRLD